MPIACKYSTSRQGKAFMVWCIKNYGYDCDIHSMTMVCPKCGNIHNVHKDGSLPCLWCEFDWIKNK